MIQLSAGARDEFMVVGAHCDDIAIGMGGTLLALARADPGLRVRGLVLSGGGTDREAEDCAPRGFSTTRCDGSGQMCEQFSPATRARVTGGDHRDRQGPIDREVWVVVCDAQVLGGIVRTIDPIAHVGSRGQRLEAV
jgi:hypothetical protein